LDAQNPTNHQKVQTISEDQFKKVTDCLSDLAEKLRIAALLLVDSTGRILAQKCRTNLQMDKILIATLAGNSYAAAREMARIAQEDQNFRMVLYEGEKYNIFISAVDRDRFLIVIFETGVALGMVRLFTKRTILQLTPLLKEQSSASNEMDRIFNDRFQSQLDQELDQSLKEFE